MRLKAGMIYHLVERGLLNYVRKLIRTSKFFSTLSMGSRDCGNKVETYGYDSIVVAKLHALYKFKV